MPSRWMFNVIEMLINEAIEQLGIEYFEHSFNKWYQFNKQHYTGHVFEDQLQKDAIHFVETTHLSKNYLVDYLVSGEPCIPVMQIPRFVQNVEIVIPAQVLVPSLSAFINGEDLEKPPQVSDIDYVELRRSCRMDSKSTYLKEIYRLCRNYRPALEITRSVLAMALGTPRLAGVAHDVPRFQLNETMSERILFHSRRCMAATQKKGYHPNSAAKSLSKARPQETPYEDL